MSEDIQVITATSEPAEDTTELGNEGFVKKLFVEFRSKNLWRKLESLAQTLGVDVQKLRQWLDVAPGILRRRGKGDGVFFYCLKERHDNEIKKQKEKKVDINRPSVREEDRYALATFHMTYWMLYKALKSYALEISQVDKDAFNNFAVALDKLESGLVVFSKKVGASIEKLPKFS